MRIAAQCSKHNTTYQIWEHNTGRKDTIRRNTTKIKLKQGSKQQRRFFYLKGYRGAQQMHNTLAKVLLGCTTRHDKKLHWKRNCRISSDPLGQEPVQHIVINKENTPKHIPRLVTWPTVLYEQSRTNRRTRTRYERNTTKRSVSLDKIKKKWSVLITNPVDHIQQIAVNFITRGRHHTRWFRL